jgi:hypothetical protein
MLTVVHEENESDKYVAAGVGGSLLDELVRYPCQHDPAHGEGARHGGSRPVPRCDPV